MGKAFPPLRFWGGCQDRAAHWWGKTSPLWFFWGGWGCSLMGKAPPLFFLRWVGLLSGGKNPHGHTPLFFWDEWGCPLILIAKASHRCSFWGGWGCPVMMGNAFPPLHFLGWVARVGVLIDGKSLLWWWVGLTIDGKRSTRFMSLMCPFGPFPNKSQEGIIRIVTGGQMKKSHCKKWGQWYGRSH